MTRPQVPTALIVLAVLAIAAPAHSEWPSSGLGVCTESEEQDTPFLTTDGAGGAFIAWIDLRDFYPGIYVQRVTSSGSLATGWPASGLYLSGPVSAVSSPAVAPDGTGGAYVVWGSNQQVGGLGVFMQRVTATGGISAGWPQGGVLVSATSAVSLPRVVADGAGGAVAVWLDATQIFALRMRPDGIKWPGWTPGGEAVSGVSGSFDIPRIAADGAGGVFVTWSILSVGSQELLAQRIEGDGQRSGGWPATGIVVAPGTFEKQYPAIVSDDAGSVILVWQDGRNRAISGVDIYAQRITASGGVAAGWPAGGGVVCSASDDQTFPRIASDGANGAIVAWSDERSSVLADLYASRITGQGGLAPGWPVDGAVVCDEAGQQVPYVDGVVPDGSGGALFVWADSREPSTSWDVYAHRLGADGAAAPGWPDDGLALCAVGGRQWLVNAVSSGAGGAIVTWEDGRDDLGDIYAARINADGTTPVALAAVSADASGGVVRVRWQVATGAGLTATVERRGERGDWTAIGSTSADGTGACRFEDRDVMPGARYGYRLALATSAGEETAGEIWVDVVAVPAFALSAGWDPEARSLRVWFSLPEDDPATLDVFDPAGRRVASRDLTGVHAGSHTLVLDRESAPRPGLHFLRLRQGLLESRAKAVVLR